MQKGVNGVKKPVKGQVKIRVVNRSNDKMILTASVGKQRVDVLPGKTGTITKANIGDSVEVYASGAERDAKKNLGVLIKNYYELEFNGKSLSGS